MYKRLLIYLCESVYRLRSHEKTIVCHPYISLFIEPVRMELAYLTLIGHE